MAYLGGRSYILVFKYYKKVGEKREMKSFAEKRKMPKLGIMIISFVCAFMLAAMSLFLPLMGHSEKNVVYADEVVSSSVYTSSVLNVPVNFFCTSQNLVTLGALGSGPSFPGECFFSTSFWRGQGTADKLTLDFPSHYSSLYHSTASIVGSLPLGIFPWSQAYWSDDWSFRSYNVVSGFYDPVLFQFDHAYHFLFFTNSTSSTFPYLNMRCYFYCDSIFDVKQLGSYTLMSGSYADLLPFLPSADEIQRNLLNFEKIAVVRYNNFNNNGYLWFIFPTFEYTSSSNTFPANSTYYLKNYIDILVSGNHEYENGYEAGYDVGYQDGKEVGNNEGYQNGYAFGSTEGYDKGYTAGVENANSYTFMSLISSVIDAPITAVSGLLDFNVFGYNMKSFYFSLLTVCVIIFVIKLLL